VFEIRLSLALRSEQWIAINRVKRGPRATEAESQFKRALVTQLDAGSLLNGTRRWRLDIKKQQTSFLFAEDFDEADLFSHVDVKSLFTLFGVDLLRPLNKTVDRDMQFLWAVFEDLSGAAATSCYSLIAGAASCSFAWSTTL